MVDTKRETGILSVVPEGWYTRKQAAELVGRSIDTLREWERHGVFRPSGEMHAGKLRVRMYSVEDIEKMKVIAQTMKLGRPRRTQENE